MIDIHSHVPTHRDAVPPEELIVNDKWRPDRAVAATTTWADYADAFADVDVSVAFTIARDRTRVDSALNDAVATFVADAADRRIGFLVQEGVNPHRVDVGKGDWVELPTGRDAPGEIRIGVTGKYQAGDQAERDAQVEDAA